MLKSAKNITEHLCKFVNGCLGVWKHSHHSIGVAEMAQSGPEGQQGDQHQEQVHLGCHHQGEL